MSNDINKLPKWAQIKIKSLEVQLCNAKNSRDKLLQQLSVEGNTNVFLESMLEKIALPVDSRIKFELKHSDKTKKPIDLYSHYIEVSNNSDSVVEVRSSKRLIISPCASNVIIVHPEERYLEGK